jgi:hypothetical protein
LSGVRPNPTRIFSVTDVRTPGSRITSREGVNAVRSLFEGAGWVMQEVALENDFGKDAYIDIVRSGVVTPLCIAVQIKSGETYRASNGNYKLPVGRHASNWRGSTVPVFGFVYDPQDQRLRWVDVTAHLQANPDQQEGSIPVPRAAILDQMALHRDFLAAVSRYGAPGREHIASNLLSKNDEVQRENVWDAWAVGRSDARYLILLRRLLLDLRGRALCDAIIALSHVGEHPNVFYNPMNMIPPDVEREVRLTFRWSSEEIAHLLRAIDISDWGYGTLGECLDVLFYEHIGGGLVPNLRGAVDLLVRSGDVHRAVRAATLVFSHSRDARAELDLILRDSPGIQESEFFEDLATEVRNNREFRIYG